MQVLSSGAVRLNELTGSTVTARGASEAVNVLLTACSTARDSSRSQPHVMLALQVAWCFEGTRRSIQTL